MKDTVSLGTESPKNTTCGFRIPPQLTHAGTLKSWTSSSVRNVSPSGAWPSAMASQLGLSSLILCWRSCRELSWLHPRQTTLQRNTKMTLERFYVLRVGLFYVKTCQIHTSWTSRVDHACTCLTLILFFGGCLEISQLLLGTKGSLSLGLSLILLW